MCDVMDGPDGPFPRVCSTAGSGSPVRLGMGGWAAGVLRALGTSVRRNWVFGFPFLSGTCTYVFCTWDWLRVVQWELPSLLVAFLDENALAVRQTTNDKPMLMQGSSFPTPRRDGDVNGQADPQSCRAVSDVCGAGVGRRVCVRRCGGAARYPLTTGRAEDQDGGARGATRNVRLT